MAVPSGDDPNERTRYYYLEKLDRITELGDKTGSAIDKALISLSGGALIFSMTFVERLAPQKLLLPLLFSSWAFFAAAILSVIMAMRGAQNDLTAQGIRASELLMSLEQVRDPETGVYPTGGMAVNAKVWRWNLWAVTFFMLGALLLGGFVGWNLFKAQPTRQTQGTAGAFSRRYSTSGSAAVTPSGGAVKTTKATKTTQISCSTHVACTASKSPA